MDKVRIYRSGTQVEVDPTSLPEATTLAKGAVKQGEGVAKDTYQGSTADKKINTILDSLRQSGVVANDKFVVIYNGNFPEGKDGGYIPVDRNVYTAGQSAVVKFKTSDDDTPYCEGHTFLGWATSPSAVTPTYYYNEYEPPRTVTFVDDDITLYAVWEVRTVTITYALGDYGTGSVPSAQTVPEGEEVQLSFSPAPTVNDGSGRVFVGWSETDGGNIYSYATYRVGNEYMTPYEDITLYPVFCKQYTVTYSLGSDATGSVPSAQTAYQGQSIIASLYPYPTCVSDNTRQFIGWNTDDGQSSATYSQNNPYITVDYDMTLYPAFEAAQVTYTCTYYNGMYSTGSVPSTSTGSLMGTTVWYNLDFTTYPTCTRAGTWNFIGWSTSDGQTSNPTYPVSLITSISVSPAANLTLYPVFEGQGGGGGGTIEIVNNSTKGYDISVYDLTDKTTVLTVSANATDSFTFDTSHSYEFQTSMTNATFNGTYNGQSYSTKGLSYGNNTLYNPYDSKSTWVFISGDGGTVTVS